MKTMSINIKSKSIIVSLFFVLLSAGHRLDAQFYYEESCRNSTGAFTPLGSAKYTSGNEDPAGNGWLRLTDDFAVGASGYVLIQESFPSNLGLTIEFDFKVWGSDVNNALADGFSVFLFDASVTNFHLGFPGECMGYLPYDITNLPYTTLGMSGAYLGVIIDEWGNVLHNIPGSGFHDTDPRNLTQHVISIAGPESAGYPYINKSEAKFSNTSISGTTLSYPNVATSRPADNVYYRRVRLQLDPAAAPNIGMDVTVYLKNNPAGQFVKVIESNVPYAAPASLRMGFAGVTGLLYAYHEVRDVFIKTSGDLSVYKNIDVKPCEHNDDIINITTTVANGDYVNISGVAVSDTLPAGFDLISNPPQPVLSGGGSFAVQPSFTTLSDGKKVYSYTLDINQVGTVQIKYAGTISDITKIGSLASAVVITPPAGFTDNSNDDNYAKAEVPVILDYSDAPASYGQASHIVFDCLNLGTWTSANMQEAPLMSINADSDDNDDAVTIPLVNGFVDLSSANFRLDNTDLKVQVAVHNSSNMDAKLIGWIDFNQNGTFDPNEAATIETVASNSAVSTKTLVWTNANAKLRNGTSYLRIRITTNSNVDATDVSGLFFNGETEDHKLNFDILEISKTAVSNNKYNTAHAMIGDIITYTVSVTNKVAGNVTVFDPIPFGTEYVAGSATPSSGTLTNVNLYGAQNIPAVRWDLGNKAANTLSTLTFKTRLTSYPIGVDSVFNIAYAVMNGDTIPSTGNVCDMAIIIIDGPHANNDTVSMLHRTPVTIDVLTNDDYPSSCAPELTLIEDSYNNIGVATVSSGKILYTPDAGQFGIDSILYQLKCTDGRLSTAKVYVIISDPLSLQYIACPGASVTMGFDAITGVTYRWYNSQTDGSIVSGGNPANTLTVIKGNATADIGTWWVEPRYGNIIFPRYRVDLEQSNYCGNTTPVGCAATGRLIYKEDFGGNSESDPRVSSEPAAPGLIDIDFCPTASYGCSNFGYGFEKYSIHPTFQSKSGGGYDHTYPNDQTKGYYMYIDPAPSQLNYKLYGSVIKGLCTGMNLNFTLWAVDFHNGTCTSPKIEMTIKDARTGVMLVTSGTFTISGNGVYTWRQFGFDFTIPTDVDSILFTIVNKEIINNCNDWNLDDIEIRICTPPVTTNITGNDTIVCNGNNLNIIGTYEADCIFGNDLAYKWEFRHVDSVNWKVLDGKNVTVDCNASNPADRTIEKTVSITSATKADEGYYRMFVSAQTNIDRINCSAVSDSVYVRIVEKFVASDLRIQVCPSPPNRTIQLSSYLDSTDFNRIKWEQVSSYPPIANIETGLIIDKYFLQNITYTLKYTLMSPEYSGCGSTSAKVYIRTLNNRILGRTVDTITICSTLANSRFVNLNQIFGLELDGVWTFPNDPDGVTQNNVKIFTSPSKFAGARVFNAQKAYNEAGNSYNVTYKGEAAKRFDFVYTAACIGGTKRVTLIVENF